MERCAVCPYAGLKPEDLHCPSCRTDLTLLRRIQELPFVMLNDGIDLAAQGDLRAAAGRFEAATAFPRTRGRALLLLGRLEVDRGRFESADRFWKASREAGQEEADSYLRHLARYKIKVASEKTARSIGCPNGSCELRGRTARGNIVLVRTYGKRSTTLWRCRACGATFSGNRMGLLFRSRLPEAKAYRIVAELLSGKTERQVTAEVHCSLATVHRLALRAVGHGSPPR